MRIVAGRFRGKALTPPKDEAIRPTSDRVRESVFNMLANRFGPAFEGVRVLDLFAGTGALGIEALSRGAGFAALIDTSPESRGIMRGHVQEFGLGGVTRLLKRDATDLGPIEKFAPFNLVFLDPPYAKGLGEKAIASAAEGGWLSDDALIVLEEKKGVDLVLPEGFEVSDQRDYGDTTIRFIERL